MPAIEPMVMTWPSPEATSRGSRARVMRRTPRTLLSYIVRHFSSSACAIGSRPSAPPALLTSSRQPSTCAQNCSTAAGSVTSRGRARARAPMADATASRRSTRRAPSTTSKPSAARRRAAAAPIPLDAPVTTAVPRPLTGDAASVIGFLHGVFELVEVGEGLELALAEPVLVPHGEHDDPDGHDQQ